MISRQEDQLFRSPRLVHCISARKDRMKFVIDTASKLYNVTVKKPLKDCSKMIDVWLLGSTGAVY